MILPCRTFRAACHSPRPNLAGAPRLDGWQPVIDRRQVLLLSGGVTDHPRLPDGPIIRSDRQQRSEAPNSGFSDGDIQSQSADHPDAGGKGKHQRRGNLRCALGG